MGHAVAGIICLISVITALFFGATLTKRIKGMQGANPFKLHKKIGVYLGLLPIATFLYGLGSMIMHEDPLFWQTIDPLQTVLHGWLGLFISIVGASQITQCITVKDRRKIRGLHMILGYTLFILLIIQTILGIETAMIG